MRPLSFTLSEHVKQIEQDDDRDRNPQKPCTDAFHDSSPLFVQSYV